MLNISLLKIIIPLFTLFKVGTILVLTTKNQPTNKKYIRTLNRIKHECWKLKIVLQTIETTYALHAEQVHAKLLLCFNSSLLKQSSRRNSHFLNFIGRLFHKTLPLKVNEFISYFWVFRLRIEWEIPLLSKCRISHENYGLSVL